MAKSKQRLSTQTRIRKFLEQIKNTQSPEELSKLYQSPLGQEFELYSTQSLRSERFPREIYDLITQNNFEEFRQKCAEKRFETKITDKKDPACHGYIFQQKNSNEEKYAKIIFKKNPTG